MRPTKKWFEQQFKDADKTGQDAWGHGWKGSQKYRFEIYLDMLPKDDKIIKVLDIGCALGDFTTKLKNKFFYVIGVDISKNAIKIASKKDSQGIIFYVDSLPLLKNTKKYEKDLDKFELITCLETLGYLSKRKRISSLKTIAKLTSNNGYFLFSGGINKGKNYFEEKDIVKKISKYFDIVEIRFNYAYLYKILENFLLRFKQYKIIRVILGNVVTPKILNTITKIILGKKGATHIIILGRKK